MIDINKLQEITEKLNRSKLLKGMAYDVLNTFIKQQKEQLTLATVVNWLPFKEENYELFTRLAKEKKLLKRYDDGTIIKDGEKEPLAIMTHFAEQI